MSMKITFLGQKVFRATLGHTDLHRAFLDVRGGAKVSLYKILQKHFQALSGFSVYLELECNARESLSVELTAPPQGMKAGYSSVQYDKDQYQDQGKDLSMFYT